MRVTTHVWKVKIRVWKVSVLDCIASLSRSKSIFPSPDPHDPHDLSLREPSRQRRRTDIRQSCTSPPRLLYFSSPNRRILDASGSRDTHPRIERRDSELCKHKRSNLLYWCIGLTPNQYLSS